MTMTVGRRLAGWLILLGALAACQEKLTSPADCPTLCPGDRQTTFDTVITATVGGDSSYQGFVERGSGPGMPVMSGLPGLESRAIVRFLVRSDSVLVRDTVRPYTIDSVAVNLGVTARDTAVKNIRLLIYHLPATVDSTTTFADVDGALTPANLIDSVLLADTLRVGAVRFLFKDAALPRIAIPAANAKVLAIGIAIHADAPTGVRVPTVGVAGIGPAFQTFVHAQIADTTLQRQVVNRSVAFEAFVTPTTPLGQSFDPNLLTVGGAPSLRALVRFQLPPRIRDSANILRVTLELLPAEAVVGVPNTADTLLVRPILADFGQKSPLAVQNNSALTPFVAAAGIPSGTNDTVRVDVTGFAGLWQGTQRRPVGLFLSLSPEGATFSRPRFNSTRSGTGHPRLRITYQLPFPFEKP